jgi:hypothetical protein
VAHSRVVEPAGKDPIENEFSRIINMLPRLPWGALPDRHIDLLNQGWREYAGPTFAEACGRRRDMKNL